MRAQRGFVFTETQEPAVKLFISVTVSEREWDWLLDKAKRSGWTQRELLSYIGMTGVETSVQREWECDGEEEHPIIKGAGEEKEGR